MVIALFGDSCTGKSSIAQRLSAHLSAEVYSGKEDVSLHLFTPAVQKQYDPKRNHTIVDYPKGNISFMNAIPAVGTKFGKDSCIRVLITVSLDTIKTRFSARMHGNLPAPVAAMLERKYGQFEKEAHDLRIDTDLTSSEEACAQILALLPSKSE